MLRTKIPFTFFAVVTAAFAFGGSARAQFSSSNKPACSDGVDNDGDGKVDYPADPGCDGANDDSENDLSYPLHNSPRFVVLFDTSGSMTWDVCGDTLSHYPGGDGTRECPGRDEPARPGSGNSCAALQLDCGSTDPCPNCSQASAGNGIADDTRIFKVKKGLSDAIKAYGEIEWSLYRFFQVPNDFVQTTRGDGTKDCSAAPCTDSAIGQVAFAGWHGSRDGSCQTSGESPVFNYKKGEQIVRFSPDNQTTLLQWMDGQSNWDQNGGVAPKGFDFELRGSGHTPLADSLSTIKGDLVTTKAADSLGDCRPYVVIVVTDGQENCGGTPSTVAGQIFSAGTPVYVIGVASQGNSSTVMADDAIAKAGSGGVITKAYYADTPDQLSAAIADIVAKTVKVEKCNGRDDNCNRLIDEGFNVGASCNNGGIGACFKSGNLACSVDGTHSFCDCGLDPQHRENLACAAAPGNEADHGCNGIDDDCDGIIDDGLQCQGCAASEVCNGLDDDCDGMIDNGPMPGVGEGCGIDIGECVLGTLQCQGGRLVCVGGSGPMTEICDGLDNNCDGVVDGIQQQCYDFATGCVDTDPSAGITYICQGICRPGLQTCSNGTFSACSGDIGPAAELCNGRDDDCDGMIDEDFPTLGNECSVGQGICKATGHFVCSPDGHGVVCDAPVVTGTNETCNGLDDDCNGIVDDLPDPAPPPIGESCGTCGGIYVCNGGLLQCQGGSGTPEVCNGRDDDCNGLVDDGDMPGVGDACVPGAPDQPLFPLVGECKAGQQICTSGNFACVNYTGPKEEVCDGKDNNCDGMVDNMATCPSPGDVCYSAACVQPCADGEFPCPFNFFCKTLTEGRFCVPSLCSDKVCPTGQFCDPNTGNCTDPCTGITCPTDTVCRLGRCLDCFSTGCSTGQICRADTGGKGHCQVDRCAGVNCDSGQTCVDGTCTGTACGGGCQQGQVCDGTQCVAACSVNICAGTTCGDGMVCQPSTGSCIADPCLHTNCGDNTCSVACDGSASCIPRPGVDVLATGGGGVSCGIGGEGSTASGLLTTLLVLAGVVFAHRRSRGRLARRS